MRRLLPFLLVLALSLCAVSALAEDGADQEFLISDWAFVTGAEEDGRTEKTIFLYDDHDFEILDDENNAEEEGSWTFDGATLTLSFGDKKLSLKWDEDAYRFTGEDGGIPVVMVMDIEPEDEEDGPEEEAVFAPGTFTGGWAAAEDWTVTDRLAGLIGKAQEQLAGVDYVPVAYLGSQVVAGANHAVLCRASAVVPEAVPYWAILYLYEDPEGNVSVLSVENLVLAPGASLLTE